MHRILLYALVVALMYLAWDARRGEVLAANREAAQVAAETLLSSTRVEFAGTTVELPATRGRSALERMEARVEERPDVWAQFELPGEQGPPAERVLTDAEQWLESSFPEGGRTLLASAGEQGKALDLEVPLNGRSTLSTHHNPPMPSPMKALKLNS